MGISLSEAAGGRAKHMEKKAHQNGGQVPWEVFNKSVADNRRVTLRTQPLFVLRKKSHPAEGRIARGGMSDGGHIVPPTYFGSLIEHCHQSEDNCGPSIAGSTQSP